jgi:hypothetical protein
MDFIANTISGAGEPSDCNEYFVMMFGANAPNAGSLTSALLKTAVDAKKTAISSTFNLTFVGLNIATTESELTVIKELSCAYDGLYFNVPGVQYQS